MMQISRKIKIGMNQDAADRPMVASMWVQSPAADMRR
jgi:hypothetical protein